MKNEKIVLGVALFLIGFVGVLSLLTMEISLPAEAAAILEEQFTDSQIKLLLLVNPTILLFLSIILGVFFHKKVGLRVPILENAIAKNKQPIDVWDIIKNGVFAGIVAGILLTLFSVFSAQILPNEFLELSEKVKPSLAARFLYGGFTEEILMRFGLMTFSVWLFSKILGQLNHIVYWLGIVVAAFIFAIGHFPIVMQTVESPSFLLLMYILIGNAVGGVIFGWLYWKKGLESAFVAHIFAHVVMVLSAYFLN